MNPIQQPYPESTLLLANDVLKVEIAAPQHYAGTRFGKGGFVTQVTCRSGGDTHTFCTNELEGDGVEAPFQGGSGLCHEFGIMTPVGYDDAQVGEWFPKFDTGLLRRDTPADYDFFADFEIQPFPLSVERGEQELLFISAPLNSRGYAARLEQKLRLVQNRLHIASRLENCGSKPIHTDEYRHNFLAFDGRGPASGVRLRVPFEVDAEVLKVMASVRHNDGCSEICWHQPPAPVFFNKFFPANPSTWWEMEWPEARIGIREEVSRPMSAFHLYATPKTVSPEAFVKISAQPGEVLDWERIYTFYPTKS